MEAKAYHVALQPGRTLRREAFRPPRPGRAPLFKPEGGLWLSLWREGWGPEWGIWWVLRYDLPTRRILEAPVWEVDLGGFEIREAGLALPDFLDPSVDGWVVVPEALPEEEREGLPRWWTTWDVATVWLRVWPGEERIRFLGTLGEVCPEQAVQALRNALV